MARRFQSHVEGHLPISQQGGKRVNKMPAVPVSLVSMPFKDLRHPPIQLGILQRCLELSGIKARSHSLEISFMDHLYARTTLQGGVPLTIFDYQRIATQEFQLQLGDWVFKVPPYSDPSTADDEYLAYVRSKGLSDDAISLAIRIKSFVPEFLESAADELLACNPSVVGFSTVFQQNLASLVLAKILKTRCPSINIVFGGGNCDGPMGQAIHECFPWVDFVVRGEGERVLVELVRDVLAGRTIREHPGLCYRRGSRTIAVPQKSEPQVPIGEIPTPTYDDYFDRLSRTPLRSELWPEIAILFESSRGCWWGAKSHCTFCGLNGSLMKFRSKAASRVVEEILSLAAKYGVLDFVAVDDIIDLHHIRELLPLLRSSGADLTVFYETKANLTKEQLRGFRDAGVSAIQPGIESLSTPVLKLMRKGVTGLQNVRLLKWCAELGITPAWNLLYGFPGEPPDEYERMAEVVPSLVHLQAPMFMRVEIERFSPYFDRPAEFGIEIVGPQPHYRFLYSIEREALADLAYDFEYRYLDGRDPSRYTKKLEDAVARWREVGERALGSLSYRRGPGFLVVQDRRPGFETADYRFDGAEAKIYLACDAGATATEINNKLAVEGETGIDGAEIEVYLRELVDARLMYQEGKTFLSLAVGAFTVVPNPFPKSISDVGGFTGLPNYA
jgi:ribosomal peptide maturation radical SAM protein 1